ncbi:hypothetical protein BGW80DRAFT_1299638 [Lactifluus volemus]|nr:hypothetical protein BGW80DRAFT_1299638 [Lactifluus volemus]
MRASIHKRGVDSERAAHPLRCPSHPIPKICFAFFFSRRYCRVWVLQAKWSGMLYR